MLLMITLIKIYLWEIQLPLTEMIIDIDNQVDQAKLPVICIVGCSVILEIDKIVRPADDLDLAGMDQSWRSSDLS